MSESNPYGRKRNEAPGAEELLAGINKALPFSDEAEKGVLSCVIQDAEQRLPEARQKLQNPAVFYREANRVVWLELLALADENKPLDLVLITNRLREKELLERVGGPGALAELFTFVPVPSHFPHYVAIVLDAYMRREAIRICAEGIDAAQRMGEAEAGARSASVVEMVGALETRVFGLVEQSRNLGEAREGALPASQGVADWVDYFTRVEQNRGKVLGLSTGILELDKCLHGIDDGEGEIVVLAGRPGMGKTALATSIATHLAVNENVPGLVFSVEMSSNQFYVRLILGGAGVDTSKINSGHFSQDDKRAISVQVAKLSKSPLAVCASSAVTTADLRAQVQFWKRKAGIRWVMVDHLHLVKSADPRVQGDERMRLVEVMETLQFLKKEHKLGVFLMVQMDRGKDREHGKAPVLADLAGSAAIEWYADHVVFIHRPPYYTPWARLKDYEQEAWKELVQPRRQRSPQCWSDGCKYDEDDGWARQDYEEDAILFIRKNRRGPTPEVHVRYEPEFTRYSSRMPVLNSTNPLDHQIGTYVSQRKAITAEPAAQGARKAARGYDTKGVPGFDDDEE